MSAAQGPAGARLKKTPVVNEPPKFDLESYISNYQGRTRLERLYLIGSCSSFLGVEALKLAIKEAKNGRDIKRYLELQNTLEILGPTEPEAQRDLKWMERTEKQNAGKAQTLEAEVKEYKTNLVKESVRMGNEDLGKHYQATGDLAKSFEAFSRMRQDVSHNKHVITISKHLIEVAIEQGNWIAVSSNVAKIRGVMVPTDEDSAALQPYLCVTEGLAYLADGEFYAAALSFLRAEPGLGLTYNNILTANDMAIYGGLCALASMDRNELQIEVLENSNFRTYLELEPHIRRAISAFVNSRYSTCLEILEAYYTDYFLDIHLQKYIEELYQLVRGKSIVQYFIPFSCVTLDSLNATFAAPGKTIDKELVAMIQRKELDARIDTQNRLLTSVPTPPRITLQNSTLKTAKEYEREARQRIQHMNIYGADLEVKGGNKRGSISEDLYDNASFSPRNTRSGNIHQGGY